MNEKPRSTGRPVKSRRARLAATIAAKVRLASDDRCCVCRRRGDQIHHIDGSPANNAEGNLAYLCLLCHERASRKSGISRTLDATTIRAFRDEWYTLVLGRKHALLPVPPQQRQVHHLVLDALRIHDVNKIGFRIGRPGLPETHAALEELVPYAGLPHASCSVRMAILEAVYDTAHLTRTGMSHDTAALVGQVTRASLPITSLVGPSHRPVSKSEREVLAFGSTIAMSLVYDGALYLHDLVVVDEGGWVLWSILRFALLNHLGPIERRVREDFASGRDGALRSKGGSFEDAKRWLTWLETDAEVFGDAPLVLPPGDIEARLHESRSLTRTTTKPG